MLQATHHASLLPALVSQLLVACRLPQGLGERRLIRMEKMLVLLLEHGNMPRSRLSSLLEVSTATIREDASELLNGRFVSSWTVKRGSVLVRWYGLTPAGVKRARDLTEMVR